MLRLACSHRSDLRRTLSRVVVFRVQVNGNYTVASRGAGYPAASMMLTFANTAHTRRHTGFIKLLASLDGAGLWGCCRPLSLSTLRLCELYPRYQQSTPVVSSQGGAPAIQSLNSTISSY